MNTDRRVAHPRRARLIRTPASSWYLRSGHERLSPFLSPASMGWRSKHISKRVLSWTSWRRSSSSWVPQLAAAGTVQSNSSLQDQGSPESISTSAFTYQITGKHTVLAFPKSSMMAPSRNLDQDIRDGTKDWIECCIRSEALILIIMYRKYGLFLHRINFINTLSQ